MFDLFIQPYDSRCPHILHRTTAVASMLPARPCHLTVLPHTAHPLRLYAPAMTFHLTVQEAHWVPDEELVYNRRQSGLQNGVTNVRLHLSKEETARCLMLVLLPGRRGTWSEQAHLCGHASISAAMHRRSSPVIL